MLRVAIVGVVVGFMTSLAVARQVEPAAPASTQPDHAAQREAFEKLLQQLDAIRLDPALVDGDEIQAARAKVRSAVGQFQTGLIQEWNDQHGMLLADRDYVMFRNACSPRLNGTVIKIGPGQPFADIATALPNIKPGTLVWLGKGEFNLTEFGRQFNFADIAIVGQGPQFTTLTGSRGKNVEVASRLLIEGVRIDSQNDPVIEVRQDGRVHLRDSLIENYNSGAGGSNGIYMGGGTLLLEGCGFDGTMGRAAGSGRGGNALDLRGEWRLFARHCQFIENELIVDADCPTVFDGCLRINTVVRSSGVRAARKLLMRDSDSVVELDAGAVDDRPKVDVLTDDLRLVEHAAGLRKEADGELEALVTGLALPRRLPYWIGLVRHEDSAIRAIAAKRLSELIDIEINLPPEAQVENETLADLGVPFKCEVEYSRLMTWLDKHRGDLEWDQATGRYRLKGQ